jgi:hypothetical protein
VGGLPGQAFGTTVRSQAASGAPPRVTARRPEAASASSAWKLVGSSRVKAAVFAPRVSAGSPVPPVTFTTRRESCGTVTGPPSGFRKTGAWPV